MGVLARRVEEVRGSVSDWYTRDDHDDGPSSTAGVRVNSRVALGLTTVWRCVDLLTSAVSQAPKDVTLKVGGQSFQQFQKPGWLVLPNPADPTYTINDYFAQISISLLIEGNYFTYVVGSVHFPLALIPLPPSRVRVIKGLRYEILDQNGQVSKTVGPDEMLHGTWMRPPGELRGISPLENLRRSIGSAVAAEEYAGRYFAQGATLSFGVEVPYPMDPVKQREFKEKLREGMSGRTNQHVIGVLTDNAKFITGLAPTPEQAQMLDTRKWGVEDLCRPYGVPPAMAGSQEAGAASFASTDTYDRWFKERGVQPLASRLESQHDRLLSVPEGVADPGASMQFRFNLDAIARVSLLERFQAYSEGVRGGVLKPNEARATEDKPPVEGGDKLYMQAQMVPLDQLGAAPAAPVLPEPDPQRATREDTLDLAHTALDDATRMVASVAAMDAGEAAAQRHEEIIAAIKAIPAPVVNVPEPVVNVAAPIVNVPAPVVNMPALDLQPVADTIEALRQRPTMRRVLRDKSTGLISGVLEEPLAT